MNQGTAIVHCKCDHEFQDRKYGKGKRVANATQKGNDNNVEVRCTVCKSTQLVSKQALK